ncbi:TetR/AcrR family transcriptional regulator [Enterococcus sp. LJL99]
MVNHVNTRQAIIDVATDLFMTHGYLATSTRQIALEVGITQPNLYSHFRNKEAVYLAVFEQLAATVQENLQEILASDEKNPEKKLKAMANELKKRHSFDFNMMMHDMEVELSKELRAKLFVLWQTSYFEPFLRFFKAEKQLLRGGATPEIAVKHFLGTLAPYIKKEVHDTLTMDQVVDFFLHGIWQT